MLKQRQLLADLRKDDTKKQLEDALETIDSLKSHVADQNTLLDQRDKHVEKLRSTTHELEGKLNLIKEGYVKIKEKNSRLQEESSVKNQNIEGINDNVLSLQIENNLLCKSIEKLKAENQRLINRWMDKVSKDADVLNKANELVEKSKEGHLE